jgi:Zn-dependent protease
MCLVSSPRPSGSGRDIRNGQLIRVGSILGVPIFITPSWLLVVVFIVVSYSGFLHDRVPGLSSGASYALALLFAITLALSVLAHEIGHTLVSRGVGLPVGRIVVFLLGGVSEIEGEAKRPRDEFAIAAAGPLVSLVLGAACWGAGLAFPDRSAAGVFLFLLAWSNLIVAIFNALPGLPLDGGRMVQAAAWAVGVPRRRAVIFAAWSGRVVAIGFALLVIIANATFSRGATSFASLAATTMGFAVAAFMWIGATQSLRAVAVEQRARALSAGTLLRPAVYLAGDTSLARALQVVQEAGARGIVIVDTAGRSRALVRESRIAGVPEQQRPWVTIAELARPLEPGLIVSAELSGEDLLAAVRTTPASEYLVVGSDGMSQGVLATADVATALGLAGGARR